MRILRIMPAWLLVAAIAIPFGASAAKYQYETLPDDPMNTMIYTLPNGLKVYMSVNKDEPRIQTNIAVRVGSKNDPAETTGLAHYFEHMMFKGTKDFGTTDYAAEKPLLDEIERLFEQYRNTADSTARAHIYHKIDSVSYLASTIAIPNEYDKLMSAIGASGTNAYTSYDYTCYVEEIPSNELERWAQVQANRFEFPVLRGFHTELETIYEEKNMSMTKDSRKMTEAMLATLFPNHPYGQWSVLGHQQHLKNPSITNIKNYHKQWYVPNNFVILMAGDFDPDNAVDIITKYFGHLKPNPDLPQLKPAKDAPITTPVTKEVWGNEAEALILAWPFPGLREDPLDELEIVDAMLNNGKAGLIDLNINKKQAALGVGTGTWALTDRTAYLIQGRPKEGQTLEEVQALILEQLAKLRAGDFDESLIPAAINNSKLQLQRVIESNNGRIGLMQQSYTNYRPINQITKSLEHQSKLTKADIVEFANKYLREDNFIAIYKRQGKDPGELKIAKQPITPIAVNRDATSPWLDRFMAKTVKPIEPVFLDYDKDITVLKSNGGKIPVLYKKNETNDIFSLIYVYDFGYNNIDKSLLMLGSYFPLLGTPDMTIEEISGKFYELACSYNLSIGPDRSYVVISGLSENMPQAMRILEDLMAGAVPDAATWDNIVARTIKGREDAKKNQASNFSALRTYVTWGPEYVKSTTLTNDELKAIDPKSLTDRLARFNSMDHRVIYYGPMDEKELTAVLDKNHRVAKKLSPVPARVIHQPVQPKESTIYIAPYDANQLYMTQVTSDGKKYDPAIEPLRNLYNEYFGSGMNSIVFQEMREARSLAYSAAAVMAGVSDKEDNYAYLTVIATQNDKLNDAINGFSEIIEDMPQSQKAFDLAKAGIDARLRTERVIKDNVAWWYIEAQDKGETDDSRKRLFDILPSMTLADVVKFQQDNVKGRTYNFGILGRAADFDMESLARRGKILMLTAEDIFGY